jgi:uncharacterized membrane protein
MSGLVLNQVNVMVTEKSFPGAGPSPDRTLPSTEPVWTFRGYAMRPAEFNTAMVHFYRGEIQRSNTWRMRLDNTTNWAVVAAGAAISFALSDPNHHYGVIILDTLLVTLFLWIEARRYRYYELWSHRVRLMETDFFCFDARPAVCAAFGLGGKPGGEPAQSGVFH